MSATKQILRVSASLACLGLLLAGTNARSQSNDPDVNDDGVVNVLDASIVASCFGLDPAADEQCAAADVDGDGDVDSDDLNAISAAFGQTGFPDFTPPSVTIETPAHLETFASSPVAVSGTVNDTQANLTVNGVQVPIEPLETGGGSFAVDGIVLTEGGNSIVGTAIDASNNVGTGSVQVYLDSTPPNVTITLPEDGDVVYASPINVAGSIFDVVKGEVNEENASVQVNGVAAAVSNKTFIAQNIPLVEGLNTIAVTAADQVGNTTSTDIQVTLDLSAEKKVLLVSGNNQSAPIDEPVAAPLVAQLVNEDGSPAPGATIVFKVVQNNGLVTGTGGTATALAETTGADGLASVGYSLGSTAGVGNNQVEAIAVGFAGAATFTASATPNVANKINVGSGNNQKGAVDTALPKPFVAVVTDIGHNPLAGVDVTFSVGGGGGDFSGAPSVVAQSDSDGRATATLTLGPDPGIDNNIVEANFAGNATAAAIFRASGLAVGDPADTAVGGVVLDNSNNPIEGVMLRIEGTTREDVTDPDGIFEIANVPVGSVHLIVDGSTAVGEEEYPVLSYELEAIAGQTNTLPGPIYLLPLDLDNAQTVGPDEDVLYTIESIPGFSLLVKAGSATFPDGTKEGQISVTQVHADKLPMEPPNGFQARFIVTIQPPGTVFDPPAPLILPNVDGYAPGHITEMYSFDHDLNQFVSIGTGTVSEDGSVIVSDPGMGIIKAGWHCGGDPATGVCLHNCPECQKCTDPPCRCDPDDSATPTSIANTPGDCKKPGCQGGSAQNVPDDSDTPDPGNDPSNICKKCSNGAIQPDPSKDGVDIPGEPCEVCSNGTATEVMVQIGATPPKLCVGETKTISASLQPKPVSSNGPSFQTPSELTASNDGNNSTATLTGVSGNSAEVTVKAYYKTVDQCDTKEFDILVLPRNVENIPGKINRFTEHSFLQAECPDYPAQDSTRLHDIDGCSGGIAQDPTNFGGLYVPYIFGSQQYNQLSTAFGQPQGTVANAAAALPLPCNQHDICYQTCGSTQAGCDAAIEADAIAVCNAAYPAVCPPAVPVAECADYADEREFCIGLAMDVGTGLAAFGSPAWTQRQTQYCLCCAP